MAQGEGRRPRTGSAGGGESALIKIWGHRGCRGKGSPPENSLAAFREAIAQGADGVELDVFLSKDNQLVVFHDKALARLTGARGSVTARTAADLKKLYLRNADGKTTAEHIPTLDEVLNAIGPRPGFAINIEIKDRRSKRVTTALAALLKTHLAAGWQPSHFLVSHFDTKILRFMRKAMPEIPIGALFGGARRPWDISARALAGKLKEAQKLPAQTVNLTLPSLTDETIGIIRRTGAQVLAWTCDEPDPETLTDRHRQILLSLLLDSRVDILITDYPRKMRLMLENAKA